MFSKKNLGENEELKENSSRKYYKFKSKSKTYR